MRLRNMPSINSHTDSAAFYAKALRWREPNHYGYGDQIGEPKKLDANGQTYKSVRQTKHPDATDGVAYAWRYHDTDVVTWLTDDHCIIDTWESLSTTTFMESLIPSAFYVDMANSWCRLLGVVQSPRPVYPEGAWDAPDHDAKVDAWREAWDAHRNGTRWHVVSGETHVRRLGPTWPWVIETSETFAVPSVNAKKAHAARKRYRTADFDAWTQAVLVTQKGTRQSQEAYALAHVDPAATILPENIHANSVTGLAQLRAALDCNLNWWSILASPHLRPPTRWSRGGHYVRPTSHEDDVRDWRATIKRSVLLAAYHAHEAIEITVKPYLTGMDAVRSAYALHKRWECDRFSWPVVSDETKGETK